MSMQLLAQEEEVSKERARTPIGGRPNIKGDLFLDFGFNTLNNRPEDLSTRFIGSRIINLYYHFPINLKEGSGFTLNPGFGFGLEKYAFGDDSNLFNNPAVGTNSSQLLPITEVFGEDIEIGANTFAANYFDIPIEVRYHVNKRDYDKGVRVALGGKVGFLYDAHSKIGYTNEAGLERKIKDKQGYGLTPIRYGVYTRIGFPGFNAWMYYGLNKVFQSNRGPFNTEANQINFGVSVALF